MNSYQQLIHYIKYAKWIQHARRRETFNESVTRVMNFFSNHLGENQGYHLKPNERDRIENAIKRLDVLPSMRVLANAGDLLKSENAMAYNCSFIGINSVEAFSEALYLLLNGVGVGFSVESKFISKLPIVPFFFVEGGVVFFEDSVEGIATGLNTVICSLYKGVEPCYNFKKIKCSTTVINLKVLLSYTSSVFKKARGRQLNSIECHSVFCALANLACQSVSRRAALISLFDESDFLMKNVKTGNWFDENPLLSFANNSIVYEKKPTLTEFNEMWTRLSLNKNGEPGIFNRFAARQQLIRNARCDHVNVGVNPCGEILLNPLQFCNLSEVRIDSLDTFQTLLEKVRIAAIIGTIQSTLTQFKFLRNEWKITTARERLLGISLTGIYDSKYTTTISTFDLTKLKEACIETNAIWAKKLKIEKSAALTCIKPSGSVSQLVNSSSGIHPRFSPYYIRRIRINNSDPACRFLKSQGIPNEPCVVNLNTTTVFSFPVKSPTNATTSDQVSAKDHLDLVIKYQNYWCQHKPSVTICVEDEEWSELGKYYYKNFDNIIGVCFMSKFNNTSYKQAPYEKCSASEWLQMVNKFPNVDFSKMNDAQDYETGRIEFACGGNECEI